MSHLRGSTNPSSCDEGSITCGARQTVRDDHDSVPLMPTFISLWVRVGLKRSDATMWKRDSYISWRLFDRARIVEGSLVPGACSLPSQAHKNKKTLQGDDINTGWVLGECP